jgi:hypothetical protein
MLVFPISRPPGEDSCASDGADNGSGLEQDDVANRDFGRLRPNRSPSKPPLFKILSGMIFVLVFSIMIAKYIKQRWSPLYVALGDQ